MRCVDIGEDRVVLTSPAIHCDEGKYQAWRGACRVLGCVLTSHFIDSLCHCRCCTARCSGCDRSDRCGRGGPAALHFILPAQTLVSDSFGGLLA